MSVALVGSLGSLAAVTGTSVAPTFAQATTAGNCLVAWVYGQGGSVSTTATGWVQLARNNNGWQLWARPNCGASETAPTFTQTSSGTFRALLAEFSGLAPSNVGDQASGTTQNTATSPNVCAVAGADVAAGELVLSAFTDSLSKAGTVTTADTFNNGATAQAVVNNDSTSTTEHYRLSWGITTGNSAADSVSHSNDSMSLSTIYGTVASLKLPTLGVAALTATSSMTVAAGATRPLPITEDFSSGSWDAAKWSQNNLNSATCTVSSGVGVMTVPSSAAARVTLLAGDQTNQGVLLKVTFPNGFSSDSLTVALRGDGSYDTSPTHYPNTGYHVTPVAGNTASYGIFETVAGTDTLLTETAGSPSPYCINPGTAPFWFRMEVVGTTIRYRSWLVGNTEPSGWVSATDSSISSGQLMLMAHASQASSAQVDDISYYAAAAEVIGTATLAQTSVLGATPLVTTSAAGSLSAASTLTATASRAAVGGATLAATSSLTATAYSVTAYAPDAILAQTNLTGAVATVQDSPDSPDGTFMTGSGATALRTSFPTPSGTLYSGASVQEFRVYMRRV